MEIGLVLGATVVNVVLVVGVAAFVNKRVQEINKCIDDINKARAALIRLASRGKSASFHKWGDR